MKKIAQDVYSLNLTDSEAFKLVKASTSSVQNKVTFVVKTYLGSVIFTSPKSFFKKASSVVGGDDKLLALYDDLANKYFCSSAKVILIESDSDIANLESKVRHNHVTSTTFALLNNTKDNTYFIQALNWIQAIP